MPERHGMFERLGRLGAGATAAAILATGLLAGPASAAAPLEWPDGPWGACAGDTAQYCIASATIRVGDGEAVPLAEEGLTATAATVGGSVTSFNWSVEGWDTASWAAREGEVNLVVKVGQFAPRYTMAIADGLRIDRATDDAGNTTMTISGTPAHIDWTTGELFGSCQSGSDCGGEDTTADATGSGWRFSGNTQDLETWGQEYVDTLDGTYIATDAQARPNMVMFGVYPEPYWSLPVLGNPHLGMDGNPVRGSFNAWLPPAYFASLGTDAETAAGVGLDVVSREGDTSVSLPAEVGVRDGGVAIDVPDLGYSVHSIDVLSRASTAAELGTSVPDSPLGVTAVPATGGLKADWSAPFMDGGSAVTGYTARAFTDATGGTVAGRCTAVAPTRTCTITGLATRTTYWVATTATNAMGEGRSAGRVPGVTAAPPTYVRSVSAAAGNGSAAIAWLPPEASYGAPVTSYTASVYATPTGGTAVRSCTVPAVTRTCTLTGLANGKTFFAEVKALNAAGVSPVATRVGFTPRTVAGAPGSVKATSAASKVKVTWAAPASNGGTPVTGYKVTVKPSGWSGPAVTLNAAASARALTTGVLKAGKKYEVSLTAVNAAGTSPVSAKVAVVVKR
jgi:hypothetical protein